MTRAPHAIILRELQNRSSAKDQLSALKDLKHELIGHDQAKELWIEQDIVTYLAHILRDYPTRCKGLQNGSSGFSAEARLQDERALEEDICLQVIILMGSLAQGGPQFLPALIKGEAVKSLLSMLSPRDYHPKLVLAVLRALNTIADSVLLEGLQSDAGSLDALRPLYEEDGLLRIAELLDQESPDTIIQQQISFAAGLIIKTCRDESRRKQALFTDVLDALAKRLASFVIARIPSHYVKERPTLSGISPATKASRLGPILHAIATIVAESKSRAHLFVASPIFTPLFSAWYESRGNNQSSPHSTLDSILPPISKDTAGSKNGNFPPLGGLATAGKHRNTKGYLQVSRDERLYGTTSTTDDEKAPLAYWLAHVAKEETGHAKLTVAWLLALLFRSGFGGRRLERILSMQLVPVLVQMLEAEPTPSNSPPPYDSSALLVPEQLVREQAPRVLALLVADNEELQYAAAEAHAIKKLSQLLKRSYDPLPPPAAASQWSPDPDSDMQVKDYLGAPGLSIHAYHVLQIRESVVSALAAMATFKDEYRKSVIDNGVVPFVVDSLCPDPDGFKGKARPIANSEKVLNPVPVLLAACEAATALSRSVSTLRTSLVDAGLAKPIFELMRHQDIQVQIAATGAVVNIVLEYSPMRKDMIDAGVQSRLCEHAHSVNAKLRLNSLWALKHLVLAAPNDLKKSCLEEIGAGWLKQIIWNDAESSYSSSLRGGGLPLTMESSNAAGEPVDLLNSADESELTMMGSYDDDDDDEVNMIDSIGALSKPSSRGRRQASAGIPDEEVEAAAQAKRDDIAVQEQGLDFIRNLISGDHASDLIDYVFSELGQEKLFDILAGLLRPRPVDAFSRDRRSSGGVKHIPPHTEIVISVCYILVHLAAGLPRHRQLLISHPDLLKLMVPIFNHSAHDARTACAWVVINLTWEDDHTQRLNARARAFELRKLGIEQKLDELKEDPVLDTRERVKQAKSQMASLLKD